MDAKQIKQEFVKRLLTIENEQIFCFGHRINQDKGTAEFKLLNKKTDVTTMCIVKYNNNKFSCSCPDYMGRMKKYGGVCKHIIVIMNICGELIDIDTLVKKFFKFNNSFLGSIAAKLNNKNICSICFEQNTIKNIKKQCYNHEYCEEAIDVEIDSNYEYGYIE